MHLLYGAGDPNQHMAVAGEFGRHRLYKMLGYFSLVGLLRLHSLLGDYHQALRVIDNMNVNRKVTYVYLLDSDSQETVVWDYGVHCACVTSQCPVIFCCTCTNEK